MTSRTRALIVALLAVAALAVIVLTPLFGLTSISWSAILHPSSGGGQADIFWRLRVPRVLMAFLAGAGLAISGMAFQGMFRNALATPFTLGVSSGASLGAALYTLSGAQLAILGISGISVAAFAGALLSILLVYGVTQARRGMSTGTMLLAGVAVSFLFSSVILFLQYISDFTNTFLILRWIMGGLSVVGFGSVFDMLPFVAAGSLIVFFQRHELNLMTTGEDIAASRGVNVKSTKHVLFFATSLMVGGIVAICGPIGFVGMMSPHICRLLIGPDHRYLAPATLLFGGTFLVLCDLLAQLVIAPAQIPVGVITALLGGPFFLWLLVGSSRDLLG
ncbi:MAG TPA: iron ABC transporter permease [Planctomycetota bacterium]|nr:iron ABC transporter permease [Planctomycetota bacterium]HUW30070.1 iron ABC transporter permease [Planctomycetota bacterium]